MVAEIIQQPQLQRVYPSHITLIRQGEGARTIGAVEIIQPLISERLAGQMFVNKAGQFGGRGLWSQIAMNRRQFALGQMHTIEQGLELFLLVFALIFAPEASQIGFPFPIGKAAQILLAAGILVVLQ